MLIRLGLAVLIPIGFLYALGIIAGMSFLVVRNEHTSWNDIKEIMFFSVFWPVIGILMIPKALWIVLKFLKSVVWFIFSNFKQVIQQFYGK